MGSSKFGRQLIESFEAKELRKRSITVRFADGLTRFFGSIWFLAFNFTLFVSWISINTGKFPVVAIFDPFPFVLLITIVSLEAIVLSIVVLMSQNKQGYISTIREEIDMHVNLIAEREITKALVLLTMLLEERGIKVKDIELEEMVKKIDTSYIERRLAEQLSLKQPSIVKDLAQGVFKPISDAGKAIESTVEKVEKGLTK